MVEIEDKFGAKLRKIRKERNLSQEELSKAAGLDRTFVGKIERGERSPSLQTISKLATALDINIQELFSFNVDGNKS